MSSLSRKKIQKLKQQKVAGDGRAKSPHSPHGHEVARDETHVAVLQAQRCANQRVPFNFRSKVKREFHFRQQSNGFPCLSKSPRLWRKKITKETRKRTTNPPLIVMERDVGGRSKRELRKEIPTPQNIKHKNKTLESRGPFPRSIQNTGYYRSVDERIGEREAP